jgi:hypothetical protein
MACAVGLLGAGRASALTLREEPLQVDLFGDTFATRTSAPQLAQAIGAVWGDTNCPPGQCGINDDDYIGFTGLVPGTPYRMHIDLIKSDHNIGVPFQLYDGDQNLIASIVFPDIGIDGQFVDWIGIVPSSGELVVAAQTGGNDFADYRAVLHAQGIPLPEPSASLLVGAGILVASVRRRSRRSPRSIVTFSSGRGSRRLAARRLTLGSGLPAHEEGAQLVG